MAGIASFGGKGAYIGKVRNDQLGKVFGHDLKATGVSFATPAATEGPATARCLILVTPDAQRTMNTYLGACTGLGPQDIDAKLVASAQVTYVEGYLWDAPAAKQAVLKAFDAARAAGRKVSITLSDSFCVHRYREEFRDLVRNKVDILFGNEAEIKALYEVETFEEALAEARKEAKIAALTRSEKGSVVIKGSETYEVPAAPVSKVVDTTGAGDCFVGALASQLAAGRTPTAAARFASAAASCSVERLGAAPAMPTDQEVAARQDSYIREADAIVTAAEERGVRLDRSIFYPTGGGQPGDTGILRWDGGE
eukprot:gene48223-64707_t